MEGDRFDDALRGLTKALSRRGLSLGLLGTGLSGVFGGLLGGEPAEAVKKNCKKKKKKRGLFVGQSQCKKKKKKKTPNPAPECTSDGSCGGNQTCQAGVCTTCQSGTTGCEGECLDLSVCPADGKHHPCNNSTSCLCTRIADNNNTRFCALSTTCDVQCGPNNSCPAGQACVMTCCDGPGNAGLRCLPSCG